MSPPLLFPLKHVDVRGTVAARAFLPLELRQRKTRATDADQFTEEILFQVDTAADMTMVSLERARNLNLVIPDAVTVVPVTTATGLVQARVRVGTITTRIPGLAGELFLWPCLFWEDRPATAQTQLGTAGVVNGQKRLRLTIDGSPLGGNLIVELIRGAAR